MSIMGFTSMEIRSSARDSTVNGPMEKPGVAHDGFLSSLRYLDWIMIGAVATGFGRRQG